MTLKRFNISSFNKAVILRHILVWLGFIAYEVAYIKFTSRINASIGRFAIYYLLNICLFYTTAHVILDFAFFRTSRPYVIAVSLIMGEIIIYLIVKFGIDLCMFSSNIAWSARIKYSEQFTVVNIWRAIYFIGLSIAYWSLLWFVRVSERNHRMETEQLKSIASNLELENRYMSVENAYLQNQISPHLLFNSLNFIYNKVYKESAEAGDSVARLSELMRYSLLSADDTRTVWLSQEVKQIENLIALCQLRFKDQFYLRFKRKGKLSAVQIIPLVLITLVENMMKHGDLGDRRQPAHILLELAGNQLRFETANKIRNTNLYPKNGLGLTNIEKRLTNYYQGRYTLSAGANDEIFNVNLMIDL